MPVKNKSSEIRISRVYDAPVQTVWEAWTDPEQVAEGWGPRGFTLTTHTRDLRPGGHWHYTMHGPDGPDYANKTKYLEVEKHARLVYDHGGNDERAPLFCVTVLFSDVKGKTRMELTMALPTPEAAENTRQFVKKAGGDATWDRLAEYLEKASSGKDIFVIHRTFEASLEKMWEMWTRPEHFSQWLPPTGFTMQFIRADIQPGGDTFYRMTGGNLTMYGRAHYLKIEKPRRLVYTQQFCDEKESIARHPKVPVWPETMLTTVTLTEEGPERTRVSVRWEPQGAVTSEELAVFVNLRAGMTQGWTGSFDKLEVCLAPERV